MIVQDTHWAPTVVYTLTNCTTWLCRAQVELWLNSRSCSPFPEEGNTGVTAVPVSAGDKADVPVRLRPWYVKLCSLCKL